MLYRMLIIDQYSYLYSYSSTGTRTRTHVIIKYSDSDSHILQSTCSCTRTRKSVTRPSPGSCPGDARSQDISRHDADLVCAAYGPSHGTAAVFLPGFALNCEQNLVTRQAHLCDLNHILLVHDFII